MKVFLDTDIVFKTLRTYIFNNEKLDYSFLYDYRGNFSYFFGSYGFDELTRNLHYKDIQYTEKNLIHFFTYLKIEAVDSDTKQVKRFVSYIKDPYDVQILY